MLTERERGYIGGMLASGHTTGEIVGVAFAKLSLVGVPEGPMLRARRSLERFAELLALGQIEDSERCLRGLAQALEAMGYSFGGSDGLREGLLLDAGAAFALVRQHAIAAGVWIETPGL